MFVLSWFEDTSKHVVVHQIVILVHLARLLDSVPANSTLQVSKLMSEISVFRLSFSLLLP